MEIVLMITKLLRTIYSAQLDIGSYLFEILE